MAKYAIDESTLKRLADTLREVSGEDRTYTPEEMIDAVATIMDSMTYILVTPDGQEIPAVFVENEVVFTADANDIRAGKTAVTGSGIVEGTKYIPPYVTASGIKVIPAGTAFEIKLATRDAYDYTDFQALICLYNTSTSDSVATNGVVIDDTVYRPNSTEAVSVVVRDANTKTVKFGINNETDKPCIVRYFTYKEE